MTLSNITLSTRAASGAGHDIIIKRENFETKEKFSEYVLNLIKKDQEPTVQALTVLKICLAAPSCHRIVYSLPKNPEISYVIERAPGSEPFPPHTKLSPIEETSKKVCRTKSNVLDQSKDRKIFDFAAANSAKDPVLKAFFQTNALGTLSVGPTVTGAEVKYEIVTSDTLSDEESSTSSEEPDLVIVETPTEDLS